MDKTSPSMKQKKKTAEDLKNAKKGKNKRLDDFKLNSDLVQKASKRLQEIVLSMLDDAVSPQRFIKQVRYIHPDGYEDIVEERSITSLCGYPMCGSRFTDKYGDRTYIIRTNKVYDITKRRKFCSDLCFSLSEFVGNQIDSSPLYLRDEEETEIRDVQLPQPESIKPRYGIIIDVTGGLLDLEDDDLMVTKQMAEQRKVKKAKEKTMFSSVSDVAIDSLIHCSENKENEETKANEDSNKLKNGMKNTSDRKSDRIKTVRFDDAEERAMNKENVEKFNSNSKHEENVIDEVSERLGAIGINEEKDSINDIDKESEVDIVDKNVSSSKTQCIKNSEKSSKSNPNENENNKLGPLKVEIELTENISAASEGSQKPISLESVHQVEQLLCEWMTFETLRTILGDKYVRGMLEHLGHSWEDYDSVQGLRLGMEAKSKYLTMCRKLDREEQEELYNDIDIPEEEDSSNRRPSGKLPDYEKLAIDAKQEGLKVVAFLQGKDSYSDEKEEVIPVENDWPDGNKLGTITEENESTSNDYKKNKKTKKVVKNDSEEAEPEVRLPHVDSYAQNTWRRQIVMEKLSKTLGELCGSLGLLEGEIRVLVTEIIATFDLSPHNIMLKPGQWTLVALTLLQMLSVRYKAIESATQTSTGYMLIKIILEEYGLDRDYLKRLLTYITQINYILTKYHRKTPQYNKNLVCGECQTESEENKNKSNIVSNEKESESAIQIGKESQINSQISKDDAKNNDRPCGKLSESVELVGTNAEELD